MIEVKVCVGSSCHMKGSYQVIKTFEELIQRNKLEDFVKLKASFCLGCCLNGIATTIDGTPVNNVGFSNAEKIFYEEIYNKAIALKNNQTN
ncbi:NAD(P)H-dependent oxidoreductase subunit E [Paludicola sp. MB14-C6]|uniref:(2Fe-2S) ferredoxin domain-containing protein n=1 Tax=Paludihabitans sp. MB14-C6 TaxID=3070656 RepID=UPI0027DD9C48|nr:NAD(P)H-dependent oxidoreductase subunit E [Paludicola sp. MB14-C6]WMJ22090.1 NAD(P)H-dependent oxidoreductase subunit E [Paludicola sp. MB14-C6]